MARHLVRLGLVFAAALGSLGLGCARGAIPPASVPPPAATAEATATSIHEHVLSTATATTPAPTPTSTGTAIAAPVARAAVAVPAGIAARVVDRWPTERRFIALSFDAGSDAGYTAQIFDTLREHRVLVSFGMTGHWAEQYPDLMRRIVADGHHLINHTYDHGSFTGVSTGRGPQTSAQRHDQLRRTEETARRLTGAEMRPYFRPPYGDYDASVNADIATVGYHYNVMWTVDSLGWNGLSASGIVQRCLARAEPGAILIFHVGAQSQDGPALPALLDGLKQQGYSFGTVAQLIEG